MSLPRLANLCTFYAWERSRYIFGVMGLHKHVDTDNLVAVTLSVEGPTIRSIMESFKSLMLQAIIAGDWTKILAKERHFMK